MVQSVVGANGLIVDFFGCVVGRRSDGYLLRASGFLGRMAALVAFENMPFYVYGDPAYGLSRCVAQPQVTPPRTRPLVAPVQKSPPRGDFRFLRVSR